MPRLYQASASSGLRRIDSWWAWIAWSYWWRSLQNKAEIAPGIGILRLKTDCFLEGMHRLIVSAKVVVDHAEILPGRGFLRLQTDGFLIVWIA